MDCPFNHRSKNERWLMLVAILLLQDVQYSQNEQAREHLTRAIQVAEEYGPILEQAEPNRHLTVDAL